MQSTIVITNVKKFPKSIEQICLRYVLYHDVPDPQFPPLYHRSLSTLADGVRRAIKYLGKQNPAVDIMSVKLGIRVEIITIDEWNAMIKVKSVDDVGYEDTANSSDEVEEDGQVA